MKHYLKAILWMLMSLLFDVGYYLTDLDDFFKVVLGVMGTLAFLCSIWEWSKGNQTYKSPAQEYHEIHEREKRRKELDAIRRL